MFFTTTVQKTVFINEYDRVLCVCRALLLLSENIVFQTNPNTSKVCQKKNCGLNKCAKLLSLADLSTNSKSMRPLRSFKNVFGVVKNSNFDFAF